MRRKPKVRKFRVERPADGQPVYYYFDHGGGWWEGYFYEGEQFGGSFCSAGGFLHESDVSYWRPRKPYPDDMAELRRRRDARREARHMAELMADAEGR